MFCRKPYLFLNPRYVKFSQKVLYRAFRLYSSILVGVKIFDKKIESLANEFIQDFDVSNDNVEINNQALERLCDIVKNGVQRFNKTLGSKVLKVYDIPKEVVSLFFTFDIFEKAFLFATQRKQIFFIAADTKIIFIYGMNSNLEEKVKTSNKITQLIKLRCEIKGGEVQYFDNTNMEVDPYDIVFQVVKWGLN